MSLLRHSRRAFGNVEVFSMKHRPFLRPTPPMGIYETLYKFWDGYGKYMGSERELDRCKEGKAGTHPWAQGFPLTTQINTKLPDGSSIVGPPMPDTIKMTHEDLFYPKAWGHPELRKRIVEYYNTHYGSSLTEDNVMCFSGGRPALAGIMAFLQNDVEINIVNPAWPAYIDLMKGLGVKYNLVEANRENGFFPKNEMFFKDYSSTLNGNKANIGMEWVKRKKMAVLPNPCNPTGHTRHGATGDWSLGDMCARAEADPENLGILFDEAYEMFHHNPVSAVEYIKDIDNSNIFVVGACTKGFQAPGIRIGWAIASKTNIQALSNWSSFGMGGISHPSQLYAIELMEPERAKVAREAIPAHFKFQRDRYGKAFEEMGLKLWSGEGGFYHWMELPEPLNCDELNRRLVKKGAAILRGLDADMGRPIPSEIAANPELANYETPLKSFFRFSFGPIHPEEFESDIEIMRTTLHEYMRDEGLTPP